MSSKNMYYAVYPTLFTTAIFGLSSVFPTSQKVKIHNILKVLNISYILIFTLLIYCALYDFKSHHLQVNYAHGVSKLGIVFQLISQIALTYVLYIVNILKSPSVLSSILDIQQIDKIFRDLGQHVKYHTHFMYELLVIVTGFTTILIRAVLTHVYMSKRIFSVDNNPHLILSFPSLLSYVVQISFVLLVKLLLERYRLANKLLQKFMDGKVQFLKNINQLSPKNQLRHDLKRIERIMELHDALTDVGNKLNASFNIQMLSCFTVQFITVVFSVFYAYYESLILGNKIAASIWFVWTLSTAFEIFNVTITCHLTSEESQNTGIMIHKLLINDQAPCIKQKLMIFSQQVSHLPLQFRPCGLFYIDATLIFTIAGAAATYLLIMLQFQEGIEAQCMNATIH